MKEYSSGCGREEEEEFFDEQPCSASSFFSAMALAVFSASLAFFSLSSFAFFSRHTDILSLYFSRSTSSCSMKGLFSSSDVFRHSSPRILEMSVFFNVGLRSLSSFLFVKEKSKNADGLRFGADGSFFARL